MPITDERSGGKGITVKRSTMNRRDFLNSACAGGAGALLTGCGCGKNISGGKKPPNILFVMIDDLGKEWLSCYGGEEMTTPNFDRLAAGGIRFTNAYSMPQCTPTRVALLTGQYPWRNGWINHWDVPRWGAGCHFDWNRYTTFARVLRDAGYATAAAGKWQVNDFRVQPDAMDRHGFDEWCMWTGYETGNPPSAERYYNPYINTRDGSRTYEEQFGADVFTDFLIDFMRRHRNGPMLCYFPMCLTHTPFTTTPLDPDVTEKIDCQKAMVRYADHCLGRLLDALDDLGIRENTLVFLTTDNGSTRGISARMNGRLVKGGKATLGENGVCEPFIVNCPGTVPSGVVSDALTDFTDMMPTFTELAGVSIPEGTPVDGASIAEVLTGRAADTSRDWILGMGFGPARLTKQGVEPVQTFTDRVVRDKRYKLWIENGTPSRLFDLENDSGEAENLIGSADSAVAEARHRLETVVQSFPRRDARPQYDPLPPQPWDRKPEGS